MFGIHLETVEDDVDVAEIKLAPETDAIDCSYCMGIGNVNKDGNPGGHLECPECQGSGKE